MDPQNQNQPATNGGQPNQDSPQPQPQTFQPQGQPNAPSPNQPQNSPNQAPGQQAQPQAPQQPQPQQSSPNPGQPNQNFQQPQNNPFQGGSNQFQPQQNANFSSAKSKKPLKLILLGLGGLIALALLVIGVMSFAGSSSVALTDYSNDELGFSMQAPEGWEAQEYSTMVSWTQPRDSSPVYEDVAIAGKINVSEGFYSSSVGDAQAHIDEYKNNIENVDLEVLDLDEEIGEEFKVDSVEETTIDGRPAIIAYASSKEEVTAIGGDVADPVVPVSSGLLYIADEANERTITVSVEALEGSPAAGSIGDILGSFSFND